MWTILTPMIEIAGASLGNGNPARPRNTGRIAIIFIGSLISWFAQAVQIRVGSMGS
jgi:hypothetical protein